MPTILLAALALPAAASVYPLTANDFAKGDATRAGIVADAYSSGQWGREGNPPTAITVDCTADPSTGRLRACVATGMRIEERSYARSMTRIGRLRPGIGGPVRFTERLRYDGEGMVSIVR